MTEPTTTSPSDQRVRRTREALFRAFFGLVLEQRYDTIRLADILARADVGRSTFYAHFRNKDALLAESLERPFSALADIIVQPQMPASLPEMLAHFAENRSLALSLLRGAAMRQVERALMVLLEQRWRSAGLDRGTSLPSSIAIHQIAQAILAPLLAWLQAPTLVDADALAHGMHRSVRGLVEGLRDTRL
jgi:AcrR family transcriptional regulator